MNAAEFAARLPSAKPSGKGWIARCPGHDDRNPSLSINVGDDSRVLLKCHAGCTLHTITKAMNLEESDLFPVKAEFNGKPRLVKTYGYPDADGKLVFQVCRMEPKSFRQRRPNPDKPGEWIWNMQGVERVLYRLPEVAKAVERGLPVIIVEGEKDADALAGLGLTATCNAGGAGKWLPAYSSTLTGAQVYIIADRDEPGRNHAELVAASVQGKAASVRVLKLPDRDGKPVKDAHDWISAGGTKPELVELLDAAPTWTPAAVSTVANETLDFDAITADVRGQIVNVLTDANCKGSARNRAVAKLVVAALAEVGRLYFHQERRDFDSAMFFDATAKQLWRIRSDAFQSWFSEWLGINRADSLFKYALAEVETAALSANTATGILPESYWASRPAGIYLSNGDGQLVKITAAAVQLMDNGTDGVLFSAGCTLQPWKLTEPKDPFETCAIFRDAHCSANHGKDLLRLRLYSIPTNPRSKPPLCIVGEIGSGKTRTAKGESEFYGVPFVAAKVEEKEEKNFWPSLNAGGLFTLDNADTKCPWLADALANAATDGCSQRKKLYTDSETVTLRPRAWLTVTTANPSFAADAGLADRLLVVRMARRDSEATSDSALTDEILANRDAGLSHVAEILRHALADTEPTPTGLNKRHPDFASFAVRIGRALGREQDSITALRAAEQDKSSFCLENDTVAAALLAYLRTVESFEGTAADLVPHLVEADGDLQDRLSTKRLGKRLAAVWPHLSATLKTAKRDKDRKGFTIFRFELPSLPSFKRCFL